MDQVLPKANFCSPANQMHQAVPN